MSTDMNGNKYKKKWGDRRDGRLVKTPGLQAVMGYILPKRTDCEVYLNDKLDVTELLKYLEKKNSDGRDYRVTPFHCFTFSLARMVKERPLMNRFVQGYRTYERNEISLAFVARRRFRDDAEEALMFFVPKDEDTIDSMSKEIVGEIVETRKSEHSTGGIDEVIDKFAALPRLVLIPVMRLIRILDFWGINPKALTDGDPNYSTIFMSNLGSVHCPSVYHHLNNYGTNSIMVTMGEIHKEEILLDDGTREIRDVVDFGATLDERIADGFYFARSLKLVKHIFQNPELLDRPLGEHSGYQYE